MRKMAKISAFCSVSIIALAAIIYLQGYAITRAVIGLPPFVIAAQAPTTTHVEMRDGVSLETHIYLPEGNGPWPTLLIRDPYSWLSKFCGLFARYNYACVHQDVRGRFGSEGLWYPLINERRDGLDTLDWLVKQPWQDGNIATFGPSYVGLVQWSMVDALPPEVKTVIADISHGDWNKIVHRNGHFVQGVVTPWALALHKSEASVEGMAGHHPAAENHSLYLGGERAWYLDYLNHPQSSDDYWHSNAYTQARDAHKAASVPILMSGAWHDFFLDGQLSVFEELPTRADSLFVIGNGTHGVTGSLKDILASRRDLLVLTLDWLAHHLRGETVASLPAPGYLLQNNVDFSRRHFNSWPGFSATKQFYLGSLNRSVSCDGGELLDKKPLDKDSEGLAAQSFVYDPRNPVPSLGGSFSLKQGGVIEQGSVNCTRGDVLSFQSPVFKQGLTISGSIGVSLKVSSDADDSAFTVKLQEKLADGRVLNIRDDITSLSFRKGASSRQTYAANSIVDLIFDLTPIVWQLRPGSALRLDISSSNYPIFNAHPNIEGNWALTAEHKKAKQTVYAGELTIPLQ